MASTLPRYADGALPGFVPFDRSSYLLSQELAARLDADLLVIWTSRGMPEGEFDRPVDEGRLVAEGRAFHIAVQLPNGLIVDGNVAGVFRSLRDAGRWPFPAHEIHAFAAAPDTARRIVLSCGWVSLAAATAAQIDAAAHRIATGLLMAGVAEAIVPRFATG